MAHEDRPAPPLRDPRQRVATNFVARVPDIGEHRGGRHRRPLPRIFHPLARPTRRLAASAKAPGPSGDAFRRRRSYPSPAESRPCPSKPPAAAPRCNRTSSDVSPRLPIRTQKPHRATGTMRPTARPFSPAFAGARRRTRSPFRPRIASCSHTGRKLRRSAGAVWRLPAVGKQLVDFRLRRWVVGETAEDAGQMGEAFFPFCSQLATSEQRIASFSPPRFPPTKRKVFRPRAAGRSSARRQISGDLGHRPLLWEDPCLRLTSWSRGRKRWIRGAVWVRGWVGR